MNKLKRLLKQLLGLLPQRQPIGRTEFDKFADDVFDLYNLPAAKAYRFTLCTMILQDRKLYRSKFGYALAIRKAQVNETVYQLMQEIKSQQAAADTATPSIGVSSGQPV